MLAFLQNRRDRRKKIVRHCKWCGPIEVAPQAMSVYTCREDGWVSLAFKCPKCNQQLFVAAAVDPTSVDVVTDVALVKRLIEAGSPYRFWSVADGYPVYLGEPKYYQPSNWAKNRHLGEVGFDEVDRISLVNAMETVDWFERLAQSVNGRSQD